MRSPCQIHGYIVNNRVPYYGHLISVLSQQPSLVLHDGIPADGDKSGACQDDNPCIKLHDACTPHQGLGV